MRLKGVFKWEGELAGQRGEGPFQSGCRAEGDTGRGEHVLRWFSVSGSPQLVLGDMSLRRSERPYVPCEGFCQGASEGLGQ